MPPRHAYWTIIFGNQPTSFRTHTQEELLPTFRQIQAKHPDAVMMWFAHGRLWKSPDEAREVRMRKRTDGRRPPTGERRPWTADRPGPPERRRREGGQPPTGDRRPAFATAPAGKPPGRRGRDWRPGGEHKDPRDRFKVPRDVKRARFKAKLQRDRFQPKPGREGGKKKEDEE
jgi:hypothetical protein